MIVYLIALTMVVSTSVDSTNQQELKLAWKVVSKHATYKECENKFNDLNGFPRRPTDYEPLRFSANMRCHVVKAKE